MALSVKVALLTSLGFIFGMSWLVSQVATPIVELPTPLVVRGPAAADHGGEVFASEAGRGRRTSVVAGCFARSSALETRHEPEAPALVVVEPPAFAGEAAGPALVPLRVPEAPVVTRAPVVPRAPVVAGVVEETPEAEQMASVGAAGSVMTITPVPEAIVANVPAVRTRLLAALRPAADTHEVVEADADVEPLAPAFRQYRVRAGDSLVKIMRREWNCDDEESLKILLAANPEVAKRRNLIYVGEVLNIPDRGLVLAASTAGGSGSAGQLAADRHGEKRQQRWYTIRKRDSLASIARRHLNDAERWPEIAKLNRLRDADKILPGMRIKLPPIGMDT